MTLALAHIVVSPPAGQPTHTAFVLHGILGSARNWRSFVRRLSERLTAWQFVIVDLRNHGDSHGLQPPHTLDACADDLQDLATHLGVRADAVIGHSFGGKVAAVYGMRAGTDRIWILDAPTGVLEDGAGGEVRAVFDALGRVEMPRASRKEILDELMARGLPAPVIAWMTTNLRRTDAGYVWRFALVGARAMIRDYAVTDLTHQLSETSSEVRLVRGGRSDRWTATARKDLDALAAHRGCGVHLLPDAGHWLHVDSPLELIELLADGL